MSYNSVERQMLRYLGRPHSEVVLQPFRGPAAWRGPELDDSWQVTLGDDEVAEIEAACVRVEASGKPLGELTSADFVLPRLEAMIAEWRAELATGRGFQVISGLPVEEWSTERSELFFWCLGQHLGVPGAQNSEGDLLGHVRDERDGDAKVRHYRTAKKIAYHCDAADVVGLLCLNTAKRGGESRICSSVNIFNQLVKTEPDLAAELYHPFLLDAHGASGLDYFEVIPARAYGGRLRTFYHSDYFRSAHNYERAPEMSDRQRKLLDRYDTLANDPSNYLEMELRPGDIQLVSNHSVVHARTEYEDGESERERRHLLRLWLTLDGHDESFGERLSRTKETARLVLGFASAKLRS